MVLKNPAITDRQRQRFGKNLSRARHRAKLKAYELAKRAGCSKSFVSEVESGASTPSVLIAVRLADVVGCALDQLTTGCHDRGRCQHAGRTLDMVTGEETCRDCGIVCVAGR
jgi:transcriptional regulator with XRE-family HTH domain